MTDWRTPRSNVPAELSVQRRCGAQLRWTGWLVLSGMVWLGAGGCQPGDRTSDGMSPEVAAREPTTPGADVEVVLTDEVVEAACGECQFGMSGDGCDLAIRYQGQTWYVDGTSIDDHGDAHADDGLCNAVRKAKVTGKVVDDRFVAETFELVGESPHRD